MFEGRPAPHGTETDSGFEREQFKPSAIVKVGKGGGKLIEGSLNPKRSNVRLGSFGREKPQSEIAGKPSLRPMVVGTSNFGG
jgi:hypothetical protein